MRLLTLKVIQPDETSTALWYYSNRYSNHGSNISESQRTVPVLLVTEKKRKNSHVWISGASLHSGTKGSPYFFSIVRQYKWPSSSRKIVEIQKFCYHGNLTSRFPLILGWVSWCERGFSHTVKQWACETILLCLLLPGRSVFKFGCFVSPDHLK